MRTFAILLFCLNLGYLLWNVSPFGSSNKRDEAVQELSRRAPQTLQLLGETGGLSQQEGLEQN